MSGTNSVQKKTVPILKQAMQSLTPLKKGVATPKKDF
jgi:hypothetical protein